MLQFVVKHFLHWIVVGLSRIFYCFRQNKKQNTERINVWITRTLRYDGFPSFMHNVNTVSFKALGFLLWLKTQIVTYTKGKYCNDIKKKWDLKPVVENICKLKFAPIRCTFLKSSVVYISRSNVSTRFMLGICL